MSQQPKTSRIVGSAEQVITQLQAQCPDLAHILVGGLAVMTQMGSRQVTLDFNRSDYDQAVDITITEDSVTIKRGEDEPKSNDKTDQTSKARDRLKLPHKVVRRKPKTRDTSRHERREPEST